MVSYGGSRGFLLICFNSAVKYFEVDIIMLVTVVVGMVILWGQKDILSNANLIFLKIGGRCLNLIETNMFKTEDYVPSREAMWRP